ncbi:hypothetical protein BH09SUM1_BH09SUM1_22210 [soil metagenome]
MPIKENRDRQNKPVVTFEVNSTIVNLEESLNSLRIKGPYLNVGTFHNQLEYIFPKKIQFIHRHQPFLINLHYYQ